MVVSYWLSILSWNRKKDGLLWGAKTSMGEVYRDKERGYVGGCIAHGWVTAWNRERWPIALRVGKLQWKSGKSANWRVSYFDNLLRVRLVRAPAFKNLCRPVLLKLSSLLTHGETGNSHALIIAQSPLPNHCLNCCSYRFRLNRLNLWDFGFSRRRQ